MEKVVRFFKQDNKWYADIPNHTLEENEMVLGADDALETLSEGHDNIEITVSDEITSEEPLFVFNRVSHDDEGAEYVTINTNDILNIPSMWLCNVAHDVFGEHPQVIYINKIV